VRTLLRRLFGSEESQHSYSDKEREYSVCGYIFFDIITSETSYTVEQCDWMKDNIWCADRVNPWVDQFDHRDPRTRRSIQLIKAPEFESLDMAPKQLRVTFYVKPEIVWLRRGQVRAYEKYLENMARAIANNSPQAAQVGYRLEVITEKTFSQRNS
jgi:hypothetical protein